MSDLGNLLKKARTERGLSLDEISETTKIQKRYLEAIEEGNFKVLPGNFYVRAFIKTYSEAVGLEPNEVLRLYRNVIPSTDPEQHIEPIRRRRGSVNAKHVEKAGKWASNLLVVLFILLILGVIYYFINMTYNGQAEIAPSDRLTQKMPEAGNGAGDMIDTSDVGRQTSPIVPDSNDKTDLKPVVTLMSTDNSTYVYSVANAESVEVSLKIAGDRCWIQAKEDNSEGTLLEAKEYKNGETANLKSDGSVWIRLGKPLTVEVTINDNPITIPETVNPINLQIDLQSKAT